MISILNVNDFVCSFLENNDNKNLINQWNSDENQCCLSVSNSKKSIKLKDPAAPKRAKSSYLFFCTENRDSIKAENPEMKTKDIIRELGVQWNNLKEKGESAMKKYTDLAEADRERYAEQKSTYVPDFTNIVSVAIKKKNKKKDPNAPTRGKSSYLFFCDEHRAIVKSENSDLKAKEITGLLGVKWNDLKTNNPSAIQKYVDLAETERIRYKEQKQLFLSGNSGKSVEEILEEVTVEDVLDPKERFYKENRSLVKDENPDMKAKEITKKLNKIWKQMSSDDKEKYN
jgi:hypothetical protein